VRVCTSVAMGKKALAKAAAGATAAVVKSGGAAPTPRRRFSIFAQAKLIFFVVPAVVMTPWTMFQRKLLAPELAQPIGRLYFWPTLPFTLFQSWWSGQGLWCDVDETALLGVSPLAVLGHPRQFYENGVRGVVNMQDEYGGPAEEYARLGMEQLWLPTLDHIEPSVEDLKAACLFIDKFRKRGLRVYIHCKAGHGRGAAAAFAWLAYSREVSSEEDLVQVNEELLSKRSVRRSLYLQPNLGAIAEWIRDGSPPPLPWESSEQSLAQEESQAAPTMDAAPATEEL